MKNKNVFLLLGGLILTIALLCIYHSFHNRRNVQDDFSLGDILQKNGIIAIYSEMPSYRSELFPVYEHESGLIGWQIAAIDDEEIFYISFDTSDDALNCYKQTIAVYGEVENIQNSVFWCGKDIAYYRGSNDNIFFILQQTIH